MKAVVLGGAGDVGSRAVEDLAAAPDMVEVTIADRNLDAIMRWPGASAAEEPSWSRAASTATRPRWSR
jgi:saccharopine dehydrogenase-like NADP-dependent oxidoreductase